MPSPGATVAVSTRGVAGTPELGGYFWVYMQYIQGLREQGCDVYWLDRCRKTPPDPTFSVFFSALKRYGLERRGAVSLGVGENGPARPKYVGMPVQAIDEVLSRADLLLNFDHEAAPAFLERFRRTAFVDLDPGLCQIWIETGGLQLATHDVYFTIGETVGTPFATFPDSGRPWIRIRPCVCLSLWPFTDDPGSEAFTTVSSWWGGWVVYGGDSYDNSKRTSFLSLVELPRLTPQPLELALSMSDGNPSDAADQRLLERHGWRVRCSFDVAGSPERYQGYIQRSRGEFSCARPSCMALRAAWVSDRTICYLASGKPAVVQHTGASAFLPNDRGLFRFTTLEEAIDALAAINGDYRRHCRAAREIAESYFSARETCRTILNHAFG